VLATGFDAQDFCSGMDIMGLGGVSMADMWHGEPVAMYGVSVRDFPNYFMTYGPQVAAAHSTCPTLASLCHRLCTLHSRSRLSFPQPTTVRWAPATLWLPV
jgi:cation diffusion facilitator CzcD-associated flavoprotein CzcO